MPAGTHAYATQSPFSRHWATSIAATAGSQYHRIPVSHRRITLRSSTVWWGLLIPPRPSEDGLTDVCRPHDPDRDHDSHLRAKVNLDAFTSQPPTPVPREFADDK